MHLPAGCYVRRKMFLTVNHRTIVIERLNFVDTKAVYEKKPRTMVWYITMTILMFMYIFQFDLSSFGISQQITSTRISVLIFYIIGFFGFGIIPGRRIKSGLGSIFRRVTALNIILFLYMLLLYWTIGVKEGTPMVLIITNFFLLQLIPCAIFYKYFRSIDELLKVVLYAGLLQAFIIWVCITVPGIGIFVDLMFNQTEIYSIARDGYAGGVGCIAAPGYLRFFFAQLACFYFIVTSKSHKLLYLIIYLFLSLTGSMIARTGLIGSMIGVIVVVLYLVTIKGNRNLVLGIVIAAVVALLGFRGIMGSEKSRAFFGNRFLRMSLLFEESKTAKSVGDIHFFDVYFNDENTYIPPLDDKTIIGTGVPSGVSGNDVRVTVDGEYLRLYVAFGLPLAIFFYLFVYGNLITTTIKMRNRDVKYTLLFFVLFSFVAVFKEWTFYNPPYLFFFMLIAALPTEVSYKNQLRLSKAK